MASDSHILLRKLEQGEIIPPDISTGIRLPLTDEFYKSSPPIEALVFGFQKYAQPNKDTRDLLIAASPVVCRLVIDSAFKKMQPVGYADISDPLQKSAMQREFEARKEYRSVQLQRWSSAMQSPTANLRLRINSNIEPTEQAYMLFGENIENHSDFTETILRNVEKMRKSRASLCERIGFVSGGDAELVFVDTINSKKATIY